MSRKNGGAHNDNRPSVVVGMPQRKSPKRLFIIIGLIAAVVVVGCGILYWMAGRDKTDVSAPATKQLSGEKLNQAINEAYAKKDYAAAADIIESQDNAAEPAMQLKLALAYANQGDYKAALTVFDKLQQAGKLTSSYQSAAADIAIQAKDKATAIKYLKLARDKVKTENLPNSEDQAEVYAAKIANLERE